MATESRQDIRIVQQNNLSFITRETTLDSGQDSQSSLEFFIEISGHKTLRNTMYVINSLIQIQDISTEKTNKTSHFKHYV